MLIQKWTDKVALKKRRGASNFVMGLGLMMMTTCVAPFAIDIPAQMTYHTQLQNALDAATLAAASNFSQGNAAAQSAAEGILNQYNVAGKTLVHQAKLPIALTLAKTELAYSLLCQPRLL